MLKRIYIDNFKCLVNFELNFDSINLFLGGNGVGKSTVFDVLRKIQTCITKVKLYSLLAIGNRVYTDKTRLRGFKILGFL